MQLSRSSSRLFETSRGSLCSSIYDTHSVRRPFESLEREDFKMTMSSLLTKQSALAMLISFRGNKEEEEVTAAWGEYFQQFNGPGEQPVEPVSDFFYPMVEQIDRVFVAGAEQYEPAAHKIAGLWGASLYWRTLFQETLPEGPNGIHIVVENECSLPFSYEVQGTKLRYLA